MVRIIFGSCVQLQNSIRVKSWIRIRIEVKNWIRICIEVKKFIRFRIKVMRIRNPGLEVFRAGSDRFRYVCLADPVKESSKGL